MFVGGLDGLQQRWRWLVNTRESSFNSYSWPGRTFWKMYHAARPNVIIHSERGSSAARGPPVRMQDSPLIVLFIRFRIVKRRTYKASDNSPIQQGSWGLRKQLSYYKTRYSSFPANLSTGMTSHWV